VESGETPWQQSGAPSIGEEAEVADADEALGEQMKQEATEKLIACEGHQLVLIVVQSRTDSLPVVSEGRLVGIVTTQDVLRVLGKMLDADQNNCPIEKTRETSGSSSEAA